MAQFDFKKKQDTYLITNQEVVPINYEIKKLYDCTNFLTISDGVILPNETQIFDFSDDGEYQIVIEETDIVSIKHYLKLQNSIIEGVLNSICDCKCGCECNDDKDEFCDLLMLRAKIDIYKKLTNPQGVAFYNAVTKYTKCLIEKSIYCNIDKEIILGESECNKEIVKQLISLDYLGMYFFEMAQVCLTEDKEYIRCKFNTKTIFCCIQSLGIDIDDIENLINNNNMGLFTINSGAYVNQAPSEVGDYTLNVNNRAVTVLTLAMFSTLTTPAYADPEGDAVKEVRIDTLPADGVLKLSGVNVTPGQVILVADVNAGNLTYESPDVDTLDNDTFEFSLSDVGSGLFSN
ncbi:MAG: hypothetical protein ACK5G7_01240 [Erysipelotrichaceae bacterium]